MPVDKKPKSFGKIFLGFLFLLCFVAIVLPLVTKSNYDSLSTVYKTDSDLLKKPETIHVKTPEAVKAIYMTACVAGTPSWRKSLMELVNKTELNSIVIDIKDYSGTISFIDPDIQAPGAPGCRVSDLKEYIEELHKNNIYVIGRITVFQDPYYTKLHPELAVRSKSTGGVWRDYKGLSFIDVGAKPYWEYVVNLSKVSYELGFDELNYDYIRYPSDGNMKDTVYSWNVGTSTKPEMLESFFSYLHEELYGTGIVTSADLFGMTTTNKDDLGIGQVLEKTLPYFDYVSPMVYPSHYPSNWNGYKNPASHPYDIIKLSMQGGIDKAVAASSTPSKLRPWLQDFNMGANYGPDEVRAQIQATYDLGLTSWILWNAGNKYTVSALFPETPELSEADN
ncbi:MAG: hypothetical protein AB200_01790 [Parcubacteria bacterium C7867-005]|nr:MAG: hypothetical protein AB200_01790 [Parcubacteria bacterium C7867-005]